MTIIIICAIIFGIIAIAELWCNISDAVEFLAAIFGTLLAIVSGGLIGLLIALALPAKNKQVKESYPLATINDGISIHGSFFLGIGSVNNTMKYSFYYQTDDYYKLKQVDCSDAIVKYTNESPRVEVYYEEMVDEAFVNYFAIDINCARSFIIYVPEGSIKQNFTLDAQ